MAEADEGTAHKLFAFLLIIVAAALFFVSLAPSAAISSLEGTGDNGTQELGNGSSPLPDEIAPINYANVTIFLLVDKDARACALDISYSSSQLDAEKSINITGSMPSRTTSSYGPLTCLLFSGQGNAANPIIDTSGHASCYGPGNANSPIEITSSEMSGIAQLAVRGSVDPAMLDPKSSTMLTAMLKTMCPYAFEGNTTKKDTSSGGTGGNSGRQGGGSSAGGGTIVHENITGQGAAGGAETVQANGSNATQTQENATGIFQSGVIGKAATAASEFASGLVMFATSPATAPVAIAFLVIIAALGYGLSVIRPGLLPFLGKK